MNAFQQAWLELRVALARYQAAEECEVMVAHWMLEGSATVADVREARRTVARLQAQRDAARRRYVDASTRHARRKSRAIRERLRFGEQQQIQQQIQQSQQANRTRTTSIHKSTHAITRTTAGNTLEGSAKHDATTTTVALGIG